MKPKNMKVKKLYFNENTDKSANNKMKQVSSGKKSLKAETKPFNIPEKGEIQTSKLKDVENLTPDYIDNNDNSYTIASHVESSNNPDTNYISTKQEFLRTENNGTDLVV